jgi:hypothetical protein
VGKKGGEREREGRKRERVRRNRERERRIVCGCECEGERGDREVALRLHFLHFILFWQFSFYQ